MEMSFLRKVQEYGWRIIEADERVIVGACQNEGCSMRALLTPDRTVPRVACPPDGPEEIIITCFDDARIPLRTRRQLLGLKIDEVGDAAGLAQDHLNKFERDNWDDGPKSRRLPNVEAFVEWAGSLGYDVILRPSKKGLPLKTLRFIERTRLLTSIRRKLSKLPPSRSVGRS